MLTLRNHLYLSTFFAAAVLSACSGAPTEDTGPASTGQSTEKIALASLDLGQGHQVSFYDEGGGFSVGETFPVGVTPTWSFTDDVKETTLVGIYRHLAPAGSAVPESLVAADARYAALATTQESPAVPPPAVNGQGTGPALYTDSEQVWFQNTFCSNQYNVKCILGWDWAAWGYNQATNYRATAYVNTGGADSNFSVFRWDPNTQTDTLVGSTTVGSNVVGQFTMVWIGGAFWRASVGNAGNSQVALAIDTQFPIKGGGRHR